LENFGHKLDSNYWQANKVFWHSRNKISTTKTDELPLSGSPKAVYAARELQYTAAGEAVQVPGVAFTSNGRLNEEIDTRIGEENAVMREICRSVVTKLELSNTAGLSFFKSVLGND